MLSDDDVDLAGMSAEELDAAWDLWFDLAQTTNESDPPFTHGCLAYGMRHDGTHERAAAARGELSGFRASRSRGAGP
jgi:hypothetical protein